MFISSGSELQIFHLKLKSELKKVALKVQQKYDDPHTNRSHSLVPEEKKI
jgi:hypothetical protein